MADYTQGDWRMVRGTLTANGRPVLMTGIALTSGNHPDAKEAEANTALALASPRMLKCLKDLMAELAVSSGRPSYALQRRIGEAIDQAEGREFNPCGGCGASHPNERCLGCLHDFGHGFALNPYEKES